MIRCREATDTVPTGTYWPKETTGTVPTAQKLSNAEQAMTVRDRVGNDQYDRVGNDQCDRYGVGNAQCNTGAIYCRVGVGQGYKDTSQ